MFEESMFEKASGLEGRGLVSGRLPVIVSALMFCPIVNQSTPGDIVLTESSPAYSQNFNTLAASGSSNIFPDGWYLSEIGPNSNSNYQAGSGTGTTGDTYSFGSAGDSERALGGLTSGNLTPQFGVRLQTGGSSALTALGISYTGEQWRLGSAGRIDRLTFQYSLDAASLTTGSWINLSSLNFVAPVTAGNTGQRNGNLAENQTFLSSTISGLNLICGGAIWLRWIDEDASGADDGLAIDDFTVTATFASATAVPEPSTFSMALAFTGCALLRKHQKQRKKCS